MRLVYLFSLFGLCWSIRFFDSCPSRRASIGACLAGLCPAGSECVNGYCCKIRGFVSSTSSTTTTTTSPSSSMELEVSTEDSEELARYSCSNRRVAIGECIQDTCPKGYKCEAGLCCKSNVLPSVTVTMIPVIKETTKKVISASTYKPPTTIPEAESEENEIESIKNSFLKKGGVDGDSNSIETTTVDEEDEYEEEEETTTSTVTSTSTTTPVTTTKTPRRFKTRKPFTTTELPEEMERWTETIIPEGPKIRTTSTTTTMLPEIDTGCPVGESIGECISDQCPEGHACFQSNCCILTPQINCTDVLTGCMPHLCGKRGYSEFMIKSCPRTCGKCHLVNLGVTDMKECRDRRSDCAEWASEGFCESSLYSIRQKLKFCGKSCKLC